MEWLSKLDAPPAPSALSLISGMTCGSAGMYVCMPVQVTAFSFTPNVNTVGVFESVTFASSVLRGLTPVTAYGVALNNGDGTGTNTCSGFGTSDTAGALPAYATIPGISATYATVGTFNATLYVFNSSDCALGAVPGVALQPVAQATAPIRVSLRL